MLGVFKVFSESELHDVLYPCIIIARALGGCFTVTAKAPGHECGSLQKTRCCLAPHANMSGRMVCRRCSLFSSMSYDGSLMVCTEHEHVQSTEESTGDLASLVQ